MGQMTSAGQVKSHDAIMWVQQRCVDCKVCRAVYAKPWSVRGQFEVPKSCSDGVDRDVTASGTCAVQERNEDGVKTQELEFARSLPARVGLHIHSPLRGVQAVCLKSTRLAEVLDPVNVLVATIIAGPRLSL